MNSRAFIHFIAKGSLKQLPSLSVALLLAACAPNHAIKLSGPQPFISLAEKWVNAYTNTHPTVTFQVSGGSPDAALTALANQKTHLAVATRKLKPNELMICTKRFGRRPHEYRVALEGVTVLVHPDNRVTQLDLDELREIFNGTIRSWSQVGGPRVPITVYTREKSSGAYELFKEQVLRGEPMAASAQTMPGTAAVIKALARDKAGIGFSGLVTNTETKTLKIKRSFDAPAIAPTESALSEGKYSICRYIFVYLDPAFDKGPIGDYLGWIRSDSGQNLAKEAGYYPLPANLRERDYVEH